MGFLVSKCNGKRIITFVKNDVEDILYDKLVKNQKPSMFSNVSDFEDVVVFKQWGYEYPIILELNMGGAAWMMHMFPSCKSSFHCHARKISVIKILRGSCLIETFFNNPVMVYEGDTVVFNKGVFHSEEAGSDGCVILQLESSPDKSDAVRFLDKYGKVGLPYEGKCKVVFL